MKLNEISGEFIVRYFVPGQATAGTDDDWVVFVAEQNVTVTAAKLVPNAAITADGSNYFTLTLTNKGAAAAGSTAVATRAWSATNSVAFVAESMTLSSTAADLNVASGEVLDLKRTHTGTGLAMPDMYVELRYKLR